MASARQGGRRSEVRGQNFGFRIADFGLRIFQLKTVSQFVIPAKSRKAGREPGSRKNWTMYKSRWIPDLVRLSGLDFYGLNDFYGFYGFYGFYDLPFTAHRLPFTIYDLTN